MLNTYDHTHPYPLGFMHNDIKMQVIKHCMLKFPIITKFINELIFDVVWLDIYDVVFGSPYFFERDSIFYIKEKKYKLIKEGKYYIVHAHKRKKIPLMITS